MKILHINTSQEGGAAWCARRINNALINQGLESKMLFAEGTCMPEGVEGAIAKKDIIVSLRSNWMIAKLRHLMMRIPWYWNVEKMQTKLSRVNTKHLFLHQPMSDYTNLVNHPLVKWADIIHLHWVPDFVDYPTFFRKIKKPIVWTLHDMYPAIGAMHFESVYTTCPKELVEVDNICRKIKKEGLAKAKNLHIVAISEMMRNIISSSDLLSNFPAVLIHNGVDTEVFKPTKNKDSSVADFIRSLEERTKVFSFSSYWIWDKRKGLDRVLSALEKVKKKGYSNIALVIIGNFSEEDILPKTSFPILYTGLIKNQQELSAVYTSTDYFINASYEEAFAQTPLEAMSCGTPVISTPCSGASDLIRPFNGIICDGYDVVDMTTGIIQAMEIEYSSTNIRKYIIAEYDYKKIAKKYMELYLSIKNN